ncbi:MAG: hypothetical protein AYK22_02090 [Thermoplasmatales archaeon SG8-52-3]|nr:MAG: hypothetical protein AYK22_02090 [Thermoplasmatales archaeon SG8-52-3]
MALQFEKTSYLKLDSQPLAGTTISNWIRVLRENKYNISWPFIPKALYVSLMTTLLIPLRMKENKFCTTYCKEIKIKSPIFIIGHWRSGTTFLHYLMGNDPNLAYVSTMETLAPNVFLTNNTFLHNYMRERLPTKRPMDNLELHADLPYEDEYAIANINPYSFYHGWYFPRNIIRYFEKYVLFKNVNKKVIEKWGSDYIYFLKKISYKKPEKRILLKSLVNTAKVKHLLDLFPDAQFIHIFRNPYDVYKSTWKLYNSILPLFSFQHVDYDMMDEAILKIYSDMYKRYLVEKSLIPKNNLYEISYETFVKNPLNNLNKIYDFLKIKNFTNAKPYFQKYIDFHKNYQKDKYVISKNDMEKVLKNWGFTFDAFGYSH